MGLIIFRAAKTQGAHALRCLFFFVVFFVVVVAVVDTAAGREEMSKGTSCVAHVIRQNIKVHEKEKPDGGALEKDVFFLSFVINLRREEEKAAIISQEWSKWLKISNGKLNIENMY